MNIREGFLVTETINGAHRNPSLASYPLLPGDIIVKSALEATEYWSKECPGVAIGGFILTPEQVATLRPVRFVSNGLSYTIVGEPDRAHA